MTGPVDSSGRPAGAGPARRWVLVLWVGAVPAVALATVGPVGLALVAVAALGARLGSVRARRRRAADARARALPELVDLFVLAGSAGLPVASALAAVAPRAPPELRTAVRRAADLVAGGVPLVEALGGLGPELGDHGTELTDVLADAARSGTPVVPALRQVAATARDRRRRAAEEAARRLPVTLLFPLACCVLPAAVLLAVVPALAGSLSSLTP